MTPWSQLPLPFSPAELRAILDPAGARPAPWWAQGTAPSVREVRRAWSQRMNVVACAAARGMRPESAGRLGSRPRRRRCAGGALADGLQEPPPHPAPDAPPRPGDAARPPRGGANARGVVAVTGGPVVWTTIDLAPNDIVVDRTLNPRLEIDAETVEHYMEVFDQLPPIEAFDTGRGRLLVDGWHRHAAGKALRRERIPVRVRTGSYREAIEYPALANLHHGRALTRTERSIVAERLLLLHPEHSDRSIASRVGCHQTTVGTIRRRLEAEGRLSKLDSRTGGDGVTRGLPTAGEVLPDASATP